MARGITALMADVAARGSAALGETPCGGWGGVGFGIDCCSGTDGFFGGEAFFGSTCAFGAMIVTAELEV